MPRAPLLLICASAALAPPQPAAAETTATPAPSAPVPRLKGASTIDGNEVAGYVAFTFDDGPSWETTPAILDLLDEAGIRAAFFVVGRRFSGDSEEVTKNREVLVDTLARGHLVGNHTFSHANLKDSPAETVKDEIDKTQRALKVHAALNGTLFRPPYGKLSDDVKTLLKKKGLVTVLWSVDADDFSARKAETVRKNVVDKLFTDGGGVVLFHDTQAITAKAFALVLQDLATENCRRLEAGEPLIVPAELDHFARDRKGNPLPVPEEVTARTAAMRERIEKACGSDDPPAAPPPD